MEIYSVYYIYRKMGCISDFFLFLYSRDVNLWINLAKIAELQGHFVEDGFLVGVLNLFMSLCFQHIFHIILSQQLKNSVRPKVLFWFRSDTKAKTKVIYTKYSKHWHYTVAHTFDCVCSKISNSWFNPWFSFYFSSLYPAPYIEWYLC